MSKGRIGYDNHAEDATIGSDDGTGDSNVANWLSGSFYEQSAAGTSHVTFNFASAVTADYFGVWDHNLADVGGSIALEYSTDGGSIWNTAVSAVSPSKNRCILEFFSSQAAEDWRIEIVTSTGAGKVAVVAFGEYLALDDGFRAKWAPPGLIQRRERRVRRSEGGLYIGATTDPAPQMVTIEQESVTPTWLRNNWLPLLEHAMEKPFFIAWNQGDFPDEVAFCNLDDFDEPAYTSTMYMEASMRVFAQYEQ